jgi:hypothetical protein
MPIQDFKLETGLQVSGSARISGSVSASQGFTGSLYGTASYGQDSNLLDGYDNTAFAKLASANIFTETQTVSGNLFVTASLSSSALTASAMTGSELNIDYIDFVPQPSATPPAQQVGRIFVDNLYNEVNTWTDVTGVKLLQGQQLVLRAKCTDMATFTKGTVVRINGGTGANATFVTASWENDTNSADTLGLLMNSGVTNDFAYIIINGYLTDINTAGYTPGQTLYLSSSGNYTNVVPLYPNHEVRLGQVVRAHATVGSVFVRVQNGYELGELHDVYTGSLSPGDLLVYENTVNTQWTNKKQLTGSYGLTGSLTASVGLSGALGLFPVLTGSNVSGTTAQFTTVSGSAISGALIGTLNTISVINAGSNLTASNVGSIRTLALTSSVAGLTSLSSATGSFTILSGSTTTGSTALFTTVTGSTISGSTLSYTTLNTTQMTSSGKILVDNNVTIGNGSNSVSTNIAIGSDVLRSNPIGGINNLGIGYQSLYSANGGSSNLAIGNYSLYKSTTSTNNIGIGVQAGNDITTQTDNILIGHFAGFLNNGSYNVALGNFAGYRLKTNQNIAIGYYALNSHNGTGASNFAAGVGAAQAMVTGAQNVAIGVNALNGIINGENNIAIGAQAMSPVLAGFSTVTASFNTAIGFNSLGIMRTGSQNLSIGYSSTTNLGSGSFNSAIGTTALSSLRTGSANTSIGYSALSSLLTGSNNVVVGNLAGSSILTGSGNVIIGSAGGTNNTDNNIYVADGAGNLRLQVDSNGVLDVKSGQIKFPSVQTASNDPNTLDDYEEGTWTPYLTGSGGSTGIAYSGPTPTLGNVGLYTKIGKSVVAIGHIKLTSTGSANGSVTIGNLPYASSIWPLGPHYYSVTFHQYTNFNSSITTIPYGSITQNTAIIDFYKAGAGGGTALQISDLSNSAEFSFIAIYVATS